MLKEKYKKNKKSSIILLAQNFFTISLGQLKNKLLV